MDDYGNTISNWDSFTQSLFYTLWPFGYFDCSYWPMTTDI